MSAGDREPDDRLDPLREAWRGLPAPAPDRPLAEEDASTQRAVEWMRDAWLALPVPEAQAPRVATARPQPAIHPRWRRVAVAAAVLIALSVPALLLLARRGRYVPPRDAVAEAPVPAPSDARPAPPDPRLAPPPAVRVAAVDAHHLELRSGPVRLYLVTDPLPPHDEAPR